MFRRTGIGSISWPFELTFLRHLGEWDKRERERVAEVWKCLRIFFQCTTPNNTTPDDICFASYNMFLVLLLFLNDDDEDDGLFVCF